MKDKRISASAAQLAKRKEIHLSPATVSTLLKSIMTARCFSTGFCILLLSSFLVFSEAFFANHVGKRSVKVGFDSMYFAELYK